MSNRSRPSDSSTRVAATALKAWLGTSRDIEALADRVGLAVSHATFSRIESAPWYNARPQNKHVIDLFARTLANELALDEGRGAPTESDELDIRQWIDLNRMDERLLAPTNDLWQQDVDLARTILSRPQTDTLSNILVRSSAELHLSRNPNVEVNERKKRATSAVTTLERTIEAHEPLYASTTFDHLLLANRRDVLSLVATDPIGLLISTMLHLLNQAYAAGDDDVWRRNMADLVKRGLVPQMAARGLFFNEPETLINTAELLFETGDRTTAGKLLLKAKEIDMELLKRVDAMWSTRLEPGFMVFLRKTLSGKVAKAAKVVLVAVALMATLAAVSPDVALAGKPIIVSNS